jgi:hypothetical protein
MVVSTKLCRSGQKSITINITGFIMRLKSLQLLGLFYFTAQPMIANSSFIYVPFEELLAEAELVVTGKIIDKQYVKKESVMFRYERSRVTDEAMVVGSKKYIEQFTEYQIEINEVIKGEVDSDVINIDTIGGCDDETGVCLSVSTGYSFELGSQVFMLLRKRDDWDFCQSTHGGYTVYLVTDEGRVYKNAEQLEYIKFNGFDDSKKPSPQSIDQIKTIVRKQFENQ